MAVTMNVILVVEKIDFDSFYNKLDIDLVKFLTCRKMTCFCPDDGIGTSKFWKGPQRKSSEIIV